MSRFAGIPHSRLVFLLAYVDLLIVDGYLFQVMLEYLYWHVLEPYDITANFMSSFEL
jgi:hypothetical protein